MGLILDSSILIAAEREDRPYLELVGEKLAAEPIAISAVTASELLHGLHRGKGPRRARRESVVETILATLTVYPVDLSVARVHARIWAELAAKGKNVAPHDLFIGATALAHDFAVVTRDEKSFPRIPGLRVLVR